MLKKIIFGLVGEMASGKGTVAKYIENKYFAKSHKFSAPLRDVLSRIYVSNNRKNMQELSFALRQLFGQDLLAKTISQDVENDKNLVVVVDGIRRFADIKYLKHLPGFKLVYITADIKTRYERMTKRGENDDEENKTFEQFQLDNQAEPESEIPRVGETADATINNNGSQEELYEQIDKIINN